MIKEEGHYTIQRVKTLPKNGNSNLLYALKTTTLDKFYRWLPNNTYEEIDLGTVSEEVISVLTYPVENSYADDSEMISDQVNQTEKFFQYVIDNDFYYEYLGGTNGNISDYRKLTADEVTIINGKTKKPVDENYADLATMHTQASQRKQTKGWIYRNDTDDTYYEYLGTTNRDATDYLQVGGGGATGLEAVNEGGNDGWRLTGRDPTLYGNIGNGAIDFSTSDDVASTVMGGNWRSIYCPRI